LLQAHHGGPGDGPVQVREDPGHWAEPGQRHGAQVHRLRPPPAERAAPGQAARGG
ncbi:unnamed protein product, partial [Heterosigma akashiwo]